MMPVKMTGSTLVLWPGWVEGKGHGVGLLSWLGLAWG